MSPDNEAVGVHAVRTVQIQHALLIMHLNAPDNPRVVGCGGFVIGQLLERQHPPRVAQHLGAFHVHDRIHLVLTGLGVHLQLCAEGGQVVALVVGIARTAVLAVQPVGAALFPDGIHRSVRVLVAVYLHDIVGQHQSADQNDRRHNQRDDCPRLRQERGFLCLFALFPVSVQHKRLRGIRPDDGGGVDMLPPRRAVRHGIPAEEGVSPARGLRQSARPVAAHGYHGVKPYRSVFAGVEYEPHFLCVIHEWFSFLP